MKAIKFLAIVPIVAGLVSFASGRLTYTQERPEANLGPINLTATDSKTVDVLVWTVVIGGGLLLVGAKRT